MTANGAETDGRLVTGGEQARGGLRIDMPSLPGLTLRYAVAGLVAVLGTSGWAADNPRIAIATFDHCPGLESLTTGDAGSELLPITTETVAPQNPEDWAGPAMGECGPVRIWVSLDHVERLSGESWLTVRTVLWAEPPHLVLGTGHPTLLHAETEDGATLEAEKVSSPNRIRFKVSDSASTLEEVLEIPLNRGLFRPRLKPTRLEKFRASIPTVVVNGFRPLMKIVDPYRLGAATRTASGITVTIDAATRHHAWHRASLRVTATSTAAEDLWRAFGGVPVQVVDSRGEVMLTRWLMLPVGGEQWLALIDVEAKPEHQPPLSLIVYEPNAATVNLPLEWTSADLPPRRIEPEPIPPSPGG